MVRNDDGSYSVWLKLGETVDFQQRKKQYKGTTEIDKVLCLMKVKMRLKSETAVLDFMNSKNLVRGKREYFLCPEYRINEIRRGFVTTHNKFIGRG